MEKIKLTPEELGQIEKLREVFNENIQVCGLIEYQLMDLVQKKKTIEEKLLENKKTEEQLYEALVAKYGQGTILIDSGEFVKN